MNKRAIYFWSVFLVIVSILTLPRIMGVLAPDPPAKYSLHVVRKGDTLDGLSKRYMPQTDPRAGKYFIKQLNGLSDTDYIQPGDVINVLDENGELEEPVGPVYASAKVAREVSQAAEREARRSLQAASRGGQREMVMEATAYTSGPESTGKSPEHPAYGITYSGLPADRGVVATDPDVIPTGTVVWVQGYGYAVALDRGGAIKGNRIDVFFHDIAKAREWGRRQVRVRVIK